MSDKRAELWNADSGERYRLTPTALDDGRCLVEMSFEPAESWFVVFREQPTAEREWPLSSPLEKARVNGPWRLGFDPKWGGDQVVEMSDLIGWNEHEDPLVRYYSGTAIYETEFDSAAAPSGGTIYLDLGRVEVMARVILNGKDLGVLWKTPYRVDVTAALVEGKNHLEIEVVNTWVNRLVGDEHSPLDANWRNWQTLEEWPRWFLDKEKRPSNRYTFTSVRHYKKDSPLQASGLLGPVRLLEASAE